MNFQSIRGSPCVPVLMFHGLCERMPEYALFPGTRSCLLEVGHFSRIIEWCSTNFRIIRLGDLDEYLLKGAQGPPPLILTFDDALASVIDLAVPVLREHQISAVVFVTTEWMDSRQPPDIFVLERIIWERIPMNLSITLDGKRLQLQVSSRKQVPRALARIWQFLLKIHFPPLKITAEHILINGERLERREVLEDRYFWFPASWEDLCIVAKAGVVEIGSHMVSHVPLPWLPDNEKLFQLEHSRDELSRVIGVPVTACSYPHGLADDETIAMAEKIYNWCFTNKPGGVHPKTRRGAAPRYHVPSEAPEQIQWLLRWGWSISLLIRPWAFLKRRLMAYQRV